MKRSLIFLLAAFLVQTAAAQDAVYDKNTDSSGDHKTIRLKKYSFDYPPSGKIAAIEVLPVMWDTARLGFVQVGMANKRIEAVPALPYGQFLQDYINRQYSELLSPGGVHILWAVKDLRINEKTFAMNERGYARLKADAYISTDGKQYALVTAFDTVVMRNGMEVTSRHDENIARVLNLLLTTSLEQGLLQLDARPATISKEEIKAAQLAALRMPILDDTSYTEGIYMSYDEFKANKPSITAFRAEKIKKKLTLYTLDANNNKIPVENAWGFCTKTEIYKIEQRSMVPLEKSSNGFVVSFYLRDAKRRNNAIFASALMGGVAGAVIASGATKPHLVTAIPYITKQQPEATALDMVTGELTL
jgi:hypothetical protein